MPYPAYLVQNTSQGHHVQPPLVDARPYRPNRQPKQVHASNWNLHDRKTQVVLVLTVLGQLVLGASMAWNFAGGQSKLNQGDPTVLPTAPISPFRCFENSAELEQAVDAYWTSNSSDVAVKYGYPIGSWCVERVKDFSELFGSSRTPWLDSFNEDILAWNRTGNKHGSNVPRSALFLEILQAGTCPGWRT